MCMRLRRCVTYKKRLPFLSHFLSCFPLISFNAILMHAITRVNIRNILMKLHINVFEVKTMCCVQNRLLTLSQFLSNFPLIKCLAVLVPTVTRWPYRISWWNLYRCRCMRFRRRVTYKNIDRPFLVSELLPFDYFFHTTCAITRETYVKSWWNFKAMCLKFRRYIAYKKYCLLS